MQQFQAKHRGSPPRVWGKHNRAIQKIQFIYGSPPRVWGKLKRDIEVCTVFPVHPHVCGENAMTGWLARGYGAVHPHVCGENAKIDLPQNSIRRFTPTCVGKTHHGKCWRLRNTRFTPTCVGKTCFSASSPRSDNRFTPTCVGKTRAGRNRFWQFTGSPPRVWGKLSMILQCNGIVSVHPHVCGENFFLHR